MGTVCALAVSRMGFLKVLNKYIVTYFVVYEIQQDHFPKRHHLQHNVLQWQTSKWAVLDMESLWGHMMVEKNKPCRRIPNLCTTVLFFGSRIWFLHHSWWSGDHPHTRAIFHTFRLQCHIHISFTISVRFQLNIIWISMRRKVYADKKNSTPQPNKNNYTKNNSQNKVIVIIS